IEIQSVVQHVDFERVVDRRQPTHELPKSLKIRPPGLGLVPPIQVIVRMQLGQIGVNEVRFVKQGRTQLEQFLELRLQQLLMDTESSKARALEMIEVGGDQFHELRIIGASKPLEQVTATVRIKFGRHEPVERGILKTLQ